MDIGKKLNIGNTQSCWPTVYNFSFISHISSLSRPNFKCLPPTMKIQVKNRDSARKIPLRTKCAFNLPSLDQMRPIKTWLIADVPLGKIIDPSAFPISSDNLFARCLLSGLRENMRTVSGAQGPLSRHGQSSGPIRRYGGACWRV